MHLYFRCRITHASLTVLPYLTGLRTSLFRETVNGKVFRGSPFVWFAGCTLHLVCQGHGPRFVRVGVRELGTKNAECNRRAKHFEKVRRRALPCLPNTKTKNFQTQEDASSHPIPLRDHRLFMRGGSWLRPRCSCRVALALDWPYGEFLSGNGGALLVKGRPSRPPV